MGSPFKYASSCEEAEFEKREDGYRHCAFCGSLHPEDLVKLLEEGNAELHGSDWKYGWPHKFYVDIKNPNEGEMVQVGGRTYIDENGERVDEPIMAPAGDIHAKFYNNHLQLVDKETFDKVVPVINEYSGITFELKEDGLYYRAPYYGYQR